MTHDQILLAGITLSILCTILIFNFKYDALRDEGHSSVANKPYSFGRVQLSWWTVIICSSFIACVWIKNLLPNLDPSLLFLLGISGGTTVFAKMIDAKDKLETSVVQSKGFFPDILNNGDIHRLQSVLFNAAVGAWLVAQVAVNLEKTISADFTINMVIPSIPNYILALLGLSSVIYLGGKAQE